MTAVPKDEPGQSEHEAPLTEETHSEDGVDLTLIRWMLSLTPGERLEILQQTVSSIQDLRGDQT